MRVPSGEIHRSSTTRNLPIRQTTGEGRRFHVAMEPQSAAPDITLGANPPWRAVDRLAHGPPAQGSPAPGPIRPTCEAPRSTPSALGRASQNTPAPRTTSRVGAGYRPGGYPPERPGRGSKPHSGSGSIRLRALLGGQGNASHRRSGLASGETAVSPYPEGSSDATPSPYPRAVSLLLRSSDSRPSGSHPTPCSPKWGLSSAAGRCRLVPPSAALHLLAPGEGPSGGKHLLSARVRRKRSGAVGPRCLSSPPAPPAPFRSSFRACSFVGGRSACPDPTDRYRCDVARGKRTTCST